MLEFKVFFDSLIQNGEQKIQNLLHLSFRLRNTGKGVLHFLQAWFEFPELSELFEAATLESSTPQKKEECKKHELLNV